MKDMGTEEYLLSMRRTPTHCTTSDSARKCVGSIAITNANVGYYYLLLPIVTSIKY